MMTLPSELCWRVSVGGSIAGVANRTKNEVRVMYSTVRTFAGNRCFPIAIAL
ncbi:MULTISPECIES: hypothetical protein [unclassified Microcoleus]|uniref:hypothetical protein n=1 Tax=unclassified Microcoleus TaxID=2642155 RepID=UPI002FD4BCFB